MPLGQRDRALVELLYGTAIRLSECVRLDVSDVDLHNGELLVRDGKGRKDRRLPIRRKSLDAAIAYASESRPCLLHNPEEPAFFLSREGKRISRNQLEARVPAIGLAAGIPGVHPHALRHVCPTHLSREASRHPLYPRASRAQPAPDESPIPEGRYPGPEGGLRPSSSPAKARETAPASKENKAAIKRRKSWLPQWKPGPRTGGYVYPHITKVEGVCGGRPCIDGTRVRVVNIVSLQKEGYTPEQMLEEYPDLDLAQVHAALTYYYDHKEEIEAIIESDRRAFENMYREWEDYVERHGGNPPEVPAPEDRHISKPAGWKPKR